MADKIAVLRAGKLEQFGRPLDLYNAPANRFVAGFIGSPKMNFMEGQLVDTGNAGDIGFQAEGGPVITLQRARFDGSIGTRVELGIRPNHLRLEDGGMPFTVRSVEQLGGETYAYGFAPGCESATLYAQGQVPIQPGETLAVALDLDHAHLFDLASGATLKNRAP